MEGRVEGMLTAAWLLDAMLADLYLGDPKAGDAE